MCDNIEEEELSEADSTTGEDEDSEDEREPENNWHAWRPDGGDLSERPGTSILVHPKEWTCRDHLESVDCGLRCPCCRARTNEEGNYFDACSICRPRVARISYYSSNPWQCANTLGLHTPGGREGIWQILLTHVRMIETLEWGLLQHANQLTPPDERASTGALSRQYDRLGREETCEWAVRAAARMTEVPEERERLRQIVASQEEMIELVDWQLIQHINRLTSQDTRMSPTELACWYDGLRREERTKWARQVFQVASMIIEDEYLDESEAASTFIGQATGSAEAQREGSTAPSVETKYPDARKAASSFIGQATGLAEARARYTAVWCPARDESKAPSGETTQQAERELGPEPEGHSTAPAGDQGEMASGITKLVVEREEETGDLLRVGQLNQEVEYECTPSEALPAPLAETEAIAEEQSNANTDPAEGPRDDGAEGSNLALKLSPFRLTRGGRLELTRDEVEAELATGLAADEMFGFKEQPTVGGGAPSMGRVVWFSVPLDPGICIAAAVALGYKAQEVRSYPELPSANATLECRNRWTLCLTGGDLPLSHGIGVHPLYCDNITSTDESVVGVVLYANCGMPWHAPKLRPLAEEISRRHHAAVCEGFRLAAYQDDTEWWLSGMSSEGDVDKCGKDGCGGCSKGRAGPSTQASTLNFLQAAKGRADTGEQPPESSNKRSAPPCAQTRVNRARLESEGGGEASAGEGRAETGGGEVSAEEDQTETDNMAACCCVGQNVRYHRLTHPGRPIVRAAEDCRSCSAVFPVDDAASQFDAMYEDMHGPAVPPEAAVRPLSAHGVSGCTHLVCNQCLLHLGSGVFVGLTCCAQCPAHSDQEEDLAAETAETAPDSSTPTDQEERSPESGLHDEEGEEAMDDDRRQPSRGGSMPSETTVRQSVLATMVMVLCRLRIVPVPDRRWESMTVEQGAYLLHRAGLDPDTINDPTDGPEIRAAVELAGRISQGDADAARQLVVIKERLKGESQFACVASQPARQLVAMKERLREESKSETEDQKRPRSPGEGPSGSKQEATKKAKILPDTDRVIHHLRSYAHVIAENAPRPNASHRPVLAQAYDNDGAVSVVFQWSAQPGVKVRRDKIAILIPTDGVRPGATVGTWQAFHPSGDTEPLIDPAVVAHPANNQWPEERTVCAWLQGEAGPNSQLQAQLFARTLAGQWGLPVQGAQAEGESVETVTRQKIDYGTSTSSRAFGDAWVLRGAQLCVPEGARYDMGRKTTAELVFVTVPSVTRWPRESSHHAYNEYADKDYDFYKAAVLVALRAGLNAMIRKGIEVAVIEANCCEYYAGRHYPAIHRDLLGIFKQLLGEEVGEEGVPRRRFIRHVIVVEHREDGEDSNSARSPETSPGRSYSGDGGYEGWDVSSMTDPQDDGEAPRDGDKDSPSGAGTGQETLWPEQSRHGETEESRQGMETDNEQLGGARAPRSRDDPWPPASTSQHQDDEERRLTILVKTTNDAEHPEPQCLWREYNTEYQLPDSDTVRTIVLLLRVQHQIGLEWRVSVEKDGVVCRPKDTLGQLFPLPRGECVLYCRLVHNDTMADATVIWDDTVDMKGMDFPVGLGERTREMATRTARRLELALEKLEKERAALEEQRRLASAAVSFLETEPEAAKALIKDAREQQPNADVAAFILGHLSGEAVGERRLGWEDADPLDVRAVKGCMKESPMTTPQVWVSTIGPIFVLISQPGDGEGWIEFYHQNYTDLLSNVQSNLLTKLESKDVRYYAIDGKRVVAGCSFRLYRQGEGWLLHLTSMVVRQEHEVAGRGLATYLLHRLHELALGLVAGGAEHVNAVVAGTDDRLWELLHKYGFEADAALDLGARKVLRPTGAGGKARSASGADSHLVVG